MAQTPVEQAGRAAQNAARGAVREAAPWLVGLARLGYLARAVVYILVGVLAARGAAGTRSGAEDTRGALGELLEAPFGRVILGVVALGLAGYAAWRLVDAVMDAEGRGTEGKAMAKRALVGLSGVTHAALALAAARMALSSTREGGNHEAGLVARTMEAPFGRWLVVLAGLGIAAFGVYEASRALQGKPLRKLDLSRLESHAREGVEKASKIGGTARGVVYVIIGLLILRAGITYDPSKAGGFGGALETLGRQPAGPWLMGIMALGLVAYGVFEVAEARYRRIRPAG
jgi:Domain of Unknown Function (DUF1206)